MKTRTILFVTFVLMFFILISCVVSEVSWTAKRNDSYPLRQIVGLSSIAIGNLNPSASKSWG